MMYTSSGMTPTAPVTPGSPRTTRSSDGGKPGPSDTSTRSAVSRSAASCCAAALELADRTIWLPAIATTSAIAAATALTLRRPLVIDVLASSPVTPTPAERAGQRGSREPEHERPEQRDPDREHDRHRDDEDRERKPADQQERDRSTGHDREPEQAADDSETLLAERSIAKRLARADTSGAERRRDHGALGEDEPDRERDQHGNDARVRPQPVGCDASLDEHGGDRPGGENAGHAARETREDREDEGFRGDHPPHLARGRSDRPEERELTPALGDHQAEDAGDDEDRDRASVAGQHRHHGDHRVALFGAGVARVSGRGVVPARDLVLGSERRP